MTILDEATLAQVITPALLIDLDAVRENLHRLIGYAGLERLRPHVKTSKLARTFEEMVGAGLTRFKCATTRETEVLLTVAPAGADVLVAYPHQGPALERFGALAAKHDAHLSVLSEDPDHVDHVPEALGIFVDVNVGMNRTGIDVRETERILRVVERAGDRFRGVHAYEGHVHTGTPDERRAMCRAAYEPLVALIDRIAKERPVPELVTSGTPSFKFALEYEPFAKLPTTHRVSPGTVVYDDLRTDSCEEIDFVHAAFVLARVVSHPAPDIVTLDAGSKAVAAEAGRPVAVAVDHPELEALVPSEEHLPCRVIGERPALGTVVRLVPRHVCPTVNLAERALIAEGGRFTDTAEVTARAHDLLAT